MLGALRRPQQRFSLSPPCSLSSLAYFPGDEEVKWKEAARGPSLRGWLLRRPGRGRGRERPSGRSCRRRGGNKGSTCLGGAAGGVGPRPRPARSFPTRPSSAARCARDSRTAGLLLAGRRREGGEQCGRGAAPRGGAGRGGAASTRRPSPGPGWGAASRAAPGARGRVAASTARSWC